MPTNEHIENDDELQEINQQLYKRNAELAVVIKTLTLLRKLYQISLLSLDPAGISEKVSETVRVDLNMEVVGLFLYDDKNDSLKPFEFSWSERAGEGFQKLNVPLQKLTIPKVSNKEQLRQVVYGKNPAITENTEIIFKDALSASELKSFTKNSHIRAVLLYPLLSDQRTIGTLFFGLNRDYTLLSDFEKDSINSLVNVVAVALDKALVYAQLKTANEELKALDQARADFITIASHQLRTPPATIKWYLAAIKSGDYGTLPEDAAKALARAEATNNSLISLIDDLLNASRIERGKMEFLFSETSLEELVDVTVDQLRPLAGMKGLELKYTKPETALPKIMADKEKLRQVMNNFIDNAIKYTPHGTVEAKLFQENGNIRFQVTDTGKGISPEVIDSIFQKYTRGKNSVTHSTGLGLGLYVAKVIIAKHKGEIWAESPGENQGSTFIFTVPINNHLEGTSTLDLSDKEMANLSDGGANTTSS
jgi:signal transduction histidine kinase